MKNRYEVIGYKSQQDYLDNQNSETISTDLTLRQASFIAVLTLKDFEIVKIQSKDRVTYVQVIRRVI